MGDIFSLRNVNRYHKNKTDWDIYSHVFDPLPNLAVRNLNDYDENIWNHSTLSWLCTDHNASYRVFNKSRFERLVPLTVWNVMRYNGTRGKKVKPLETKCLRGLPTIVRKLIARLKRKKIECSQDIKVNGRNYWAIVTDLSMAVSQVSALKGVNNPMFGSKILHFLMPEFFPMWDTKFVEEKALVRENLPEIPTYVSKQLPALAAKRYAEYMNLMLRDRACTSDREYAAIEKRVLELASGRQAYPWIKKVVEWHYNDLTPTVFEICLLGKWV